MDTFSKDMYIFYYYYPNMQNKFISDLLYVRELNEIIIHHFVSERFMSSYFVVDKIMFLPLVISSAEFRYKTKSLLTLYYIIFLFWFSIEYLFSPLIILE